MPFVCEGQGLFILSCDSACWCNLIPRVRKKKLNAASSWPFSFLSCVCALRFLFPLACVAMETSILRKLLSWVFTWRDYSLCVWMQTFSAINLYILRCTLQWAVFPNSVFKLFQLVVFCKHLLNLLHTGVNWTKCQWWPFQVQYLQREGGRVQRFLRDSFFVQPWVVDGTSFRLGWQVRQFDWISDF